MMALARTFPAPVFTAHDWIAAYSAGGRVYTVDTGICVEYGDGPQDIPLPALYAMREWEDATPDWKERVIAVLGSA